MRVNNSDAAHHVRGREDFTGSNMFGVNHRHVYVVYSYGKHFPMYLYDNQSGRWVGNSDKYSRSTTRHQSQTRPYDIDKWVTTDEIIDIDRAGSMVEFIRRKLNVK